MTSWDSFAADAPDLAERVRARFEATKHKTMATLRVDGSPRISGTETQFALGDLVIGSMPGARKLADLQRDPRLALHSATVDPVPGHEPEWPGEAKVAGTAQPAPPAEGPPGDYFRIALSEVVLTTINASGTALVVESWHPGRGYERVERA